MHRHYGYENCAYHGIVFDYGTNPKRKPVRGMLAGNGLLTTHTPAIYISLALPHSVSLFLCLSFSLLSVCQSVRLSVCDRRQQAAVKTIFRLAFQTFYGFISTKISPLNTQIVACHSCFILAYHSMCPLLSLPLSIHSFRTRSIYIGRLLIHCHEPFITHTLRDPFRGIRGGQTNILILKYLPNYKFHSKKKANNAYLRFLSKNIELEVCLL